MKTFLYTFFIFLALFCTTSQANEPDRKLHIKCLYPTIQVFSESKKSFGSGVIVKSIKISPQEYHNVFITAAHVVDENFFYQVKVFEYEDWSTLIKTHSYKCVFYATEYDRDLAVGMFVTDKAMPVANIDMNYKFYIGSDVFRIGCGLGDEPRLDLGKLTSLRSKLSTTNHWLLRTSIHTTPGDSGGPLFNSCYKVIGIARSIRIWNGHVFFNISHYVPITSLKEWSESEKGVYDFVWQNQPLPSIPIWELRFHRDYQSIRMP